MKKKTMKRALLASALSLVLCVSMLVGTTYAWFTDSVASANNIIKSGNLDVELYNGLDNTAPKVTGNTKLFDDITYWEPGVVAFENLTVANEGSLALKYQLAINFTNATKTSEGKTLADVLKVAVVSGGFNGDREDAKDLAYNYSLATFALDGALEYNESDVYGIVIYWEPGANDNDYNVADGLSITLGVNLFATQYTSEIDSFDNQYDNLTIVSNEAQLAAALANGGNIMLANDIAITDGNGFSFAAAKDSVLHLNGNNIVKVSTNSDVNGDGKFTSFDNQGIFQVKGNLSVVGDGVISMENTGANMGWNALTAVFSVEGGNLTLGDGVTVTHKGGSDMAYAVDVNTSAGASTLTVDGATLTSSYTAIRLFNFNATNTATVNVNSGIISGAKRDIWRQADGAYALNIAPDMPYTTDEGSYIYSFDGVYVSSASALQTALNNAVDGTVIDFISDITGDVTVAQKADVKITIDGNGNNFDGTLLVDGKSATYTSAGLTIKNVKFVGATADACIQLGNGDNSTRYTCNVTVEGCTFDAPGKVGVKSYTGGDKNVTIKACTATANAHSLVQLKGVDGVLVENCEVYSKNGINLNNSNNVTIKGCTVDVKGYAVRFGEGSAADTAAETYKIENCTLKSANDDGDATIVLRGTAACATLTIVNTTIEGTPDITNTVGATVVK